MPELCTVGEGRPAGHGSNSMVWACPKCRLAWIAAAFDPDVMPFAPVRQVRKARKVAELIDDPRLALAADVLEARITPDDDGMGF